MRDYKFSDRWIDLTKVFEDLKPLMDQLRLIPLSNNKDVIVWGDTTNGHYLVASGYASLLPHV